MANTQNLLRFITDKLSNEINALCVRYQIRCHSQKLCFHYEIREWILKSESPSTLA